MVLFAAAACGGPSGPARPRPLGFHFKEQYIARVPPEQTSAMVAAREAWRKAQADQRKAASDHARSKGALDAARQKARQARDQKEAADGQRSAAEGSKDWKRINLAKRDQRVAEVTLRAAEQKVAMLEARRSWLEKHMLFSAENLYALEARYELEKAKVARANNIAPPDFAYQAYVDQYEQRRRKAEKLKGPADSAREEWVEATREYEARRRDENEARGIDTAARPDSP